jgi:hypothetical protein
VISNRYAYRVTAAVTALFPSANPSTGKALGGLKNGAIVDLRCAGNRNQRYGAPRSMPETSANWAQHEAESMAGYRKNYREIENEVSLALDGLAKDLGTSIADSGAPAGQNLGNTAADAIAAKSDGIGARIGAAFLGVVGPALSDLMKPVGSLPRRNGVNADLGRSGGDVQASGGQ